MARAKGEKQYIALTKGLITEASPLAAPEGSTSDELNMDLEIKGMIRKRRKGLEKKITDVSIDGIVTGSYYWPSANLVVVSTLSDNPSKTLDTVHLYFRDASDLSVKYDYRFEVLEDTASIPSFSEIRNRMLVTFGATPFVFEYNKASTNLSAWSLQLYIRDFKVQDDGLSMSERPLSLNNAHKYNLYNSGWYRDRDVSGGAIEDPITKFFNELAVYPSNADIVYLGDFPNADGVDEFNPFKLQNADVGNSPAPRGHYVYNIRDITRSDKLISKEEDGTPPQTIDLVLDDGTNVSGLTGNILYSDAEPVGEPVDPYIPPYKPGGGPIFIKP